MANAYSYVVFTGKVVYALVSGTKDYESLTDQLGVVMTLHGGLMVVAGLDSATRCSAGERCRRGRLLR